MGDIVVEGIRLSVSYGKHRAVSDMSFRVDADDAGKTTLFKTVCGDIGRYDGALRCPSRDEIAYLPDKPFLFSWMTVGQAIDLFSARHQDFRDDVAEEFLAGSAIKRSAPVGSLSKGMSERLHLALIMARRPRLYVLDEPLAGVDPLTRDRLIENIIEVRCQEAPMLLSTYLIEGVERVFDAVMMVVDGLLRSGKVADVRRIGDGSLEMAFKRLVAAHE